MPDKVTEGEWVADKEGYVVASAIDKDVADCDTWAPIEERNANARLMAASKKMYRFIKTIRGSFAEADKLIQEINVEVD